MATKSDFAQKLLQDLRMRKERMATTQNSSRQSSQTSRVVQGNHGQTSRGSRQINALESAGSRTGITSRRSNGGSRSTNIKESSNQIVLYGNGQSSKQVRDLSMAIAFALENTGNLSNIGISSTDSLVNFFSRFGRRTMDNRKMELTNFSNHTVSHLHVTDISKGVQKLNHILQGFSFDANSIEVGKELLKGAIGLEESLRMLADLQENSQYVNRAQKKHHIKLLDEDEEDDQADNDKTADQWKLDRPKFSFDKPSRNVNSYVVQGSTRRQQLALSYPDETSEKPKLVPHKRSTSCVQDLSLSTQVRLNNNSSSSLSTQEKRGISNVIAKLMGLEELSQSEDMKRDSKEKQGKHSRKDNKLSQPLSRESRNGSTLGTNKKATQTNNTSSIRDSELHLKAENKNPDNSSKMVNSERNQPQRDLKIPAVPTEAAPGTMSKQQSHKIAANQANGLHRQQNFIESKQSKTMENESKILNTKLQQKARSSKTHKAEEIEYRVPANLGERRKADKDLPSNKMRPHDNHVLLQEPVLKRTEHSEDTHQADKKDQQLQKQNLAAKNHVAEQVESIVALKSKRSTAVNLQRLSRDKSTTNNGRFTKQTEKVPAKDPPKRGHQDVVPMIDISHKTASNKENLKKEEQRLTSSTRPPQFDIEEEISYPVLTVEKPIEVPATQKQAAIPRKIQRGEIPKKIDVLMTRRNATTKQLTRSIKQPATMLRGLKQQMHNKNSSSKGLEEQSKSKGDEGRTSRSMYNESEKISEPAKQQDKLQNEDDQTIISNIYVADEFQTQTIQSTLALNDKCDTVALDFGKVSNDHQTIEQPHTPNEEQELQHCEQSIDIAGEYDEDRGLHNLPQHEYNHLPGFARQEQLTEAEKDLKEIIIKSQLILSTAVALFKLNIPLSFLHAGEYDDVVVAEKKLILNCAHEIMKRKARRHEVTYHPYTKTTISCNKMRSLDDLVRELCKELEILKFYGGNGTDECDVAASLHKMLDNDIYNTDPDVNSMWDFEWSKLMSVFPEKEDIVKDVERHMLNGLLDEIMNDLLVITVSV